MGLIAALAAALAATCAALAWDGPGLAGTHVSPLLFAAALVPGIVLAGTRPQRQPVARFERYLLIGALGALALTLFDLTQQRQQAPLLLRFLILAVLPLSLLWPRPHVVRCCVLLSGASLLGATTSAPGWAAIGVIGGGATALVAANHLTLAGFAALAPQRMLGRRVAGSAGAVFLVAVALASLAAAFVPPPAGGSGGGGGSRLRPRGAGQSFREDRPPPYLFEGELDLAKAQKDRSKRVLFKVTADRPDFWHALSYDQWNGRSWSRSADFTRFRDGPPPQSLMVPSGVGDGPPGPEALLQRIRFKVSAAVLVAARRPVQASDPAGFVYPTLDGSLVGFAPKGQQYEIVSRRPARDEKLLRGGDPLTPEVPNEIGRLYLPASPMSERVRSLAVQIAADRSNAYDKAAAVESWLAANTALGPDAATSPDDDVVDRFLFVDRRGSSERTATAMAIILRSLGIPSRLAGGFAPGETSAGPKQFVVRARDAHARVEAWFSGGGWQSFDPRPPQPRVVSEEESTRPYWLLAAVAVAIVTAAWLAWRRWRRVRAMRWETRSFARLARAGAARGRPRQPHETVAEYTQALSESALPDPRLVEVGATITSAAYSGQEPTAAERARADGMLRELTKRRRRPPRRLRPRA